MELILFIAALIAIAIVGRGRVGPIDLSDLLRPWQRWGLVGLAVILALGSGLKWQIERTDNFRVVSASLVPVNSVSGACPADQVFEANVETKGGAGSLMFRVYTDGGYSGQLQSKEVKRSGTAAMDVAVRVDRPASGARIGRDVAHLRVLEPRRFDSPPVTFEIECLSR